MEQDPPGYEQHDRRALVILNEIAEALNGSVELPQALEVTLELVGQRLGLETGWIWLLDEETGEPFLAAARGLPAGLRGEPARMQGTCWCLDAYASGQLEGSANISVITCSRLKGLDPAGSAGLRCHASVPVQARGRRVGLLNVAATNWRELTETELRLLRTVGELLGMAVARAWVQARSAMLGATEERNRLAREIHDTLAQGMAAATMHLEAADALLEAGAPVERSRASVQRAMELLRENLEEARRSVLDLRAAPLEGRSLSEALESLACWHRQEGLALEVAVGGVGALPSRVEVGLLRITQEALNNVSRHAGASRAALRLTRHLGALTLEIEDDGVGFDPAQVAPSRFGLRGLGERAALLGGRMALETAPGAGTRLRVTIPLEGQA